MTEAQKNALLADLQPVLEKLKGVPFDKGIRPFQDDVWRLGDKYGITGPEVVQILMENWPNKDKE